MHMFPEDEAQAAVELPKTDQEQLLEWLLQALILQLHWTPTYLEMQLLPLILRQPHRSLVVKVSLWLPTTFSKGHLYAGCAISHCAARQPLHGLPRNFHTVFCIMPTQPVLMFEMLSVNTCRQSCPTAT